MDHIGSRHVDLCSDGFMYEDKGVSGWAERWVRSHITESSTEYLRNCASKDKCELGSDSSSGPI